MSFEEVFAKSEKAEYWVNIGNHQTKKELLQINWENLEVLLVQITELHYEQEAIMNICQR